MQSSRGASTDDDQVEVAAQRGPRDVAALDHHDARAATVATSSPRRSVVPVVAAVARLLAAHERGQGLVAQALPVEQQVDRLERRQRRARALGQRAVEVVALDDRDVVAQQRELARERALARAARAVDADDDRGPLVRGRVDRRRDALGRGEVVRLAQRLRQQVAVGVEHLVHEGVDLVEREARGGVRVEHRGVPHVVAPPSSTARTVRSQTFENVRLSAAHCGATSPTCVGLTPVRSTRHGTSTQMSAGRFVIRPVLRTLP